MGGGELRRLDPDSVGVTMVDISVPLPEDWRTVRDVRLWSLQDSPDAFTSTYRHEAAFDEATWRRRATTCRWFLASDHRATIGIAGGVTGWSHDPGDRELVGMWVAPSHRNRGVARLLLDAVGSWARSEGATTLLLGVRAANTGARAAYLRMGLRATGERMAEVGAVHESIEVGVGSHRPLTPCGRDPPLTGRLGQATTGVAVAGVSVGMGIAPAGAVTARALPQPDRCRVSPPTVTATGRWVPPTATQQVTGPVSSPPFWYVMAAARTPSTVWVRPS
jgi:GNAT superfamily N-acetyltransferase